MEHMARPGTLVSREEYLATSYRPDCDYLEGVLLERNLGEFEHSRMQTLLATLLRLGEKRWGILAVTEQRVQVRSDRFRVPDVCVVRAGYALEPVFRQPPLLCVEILSKDDRMSEMQERIDDYLAMGVPHVWLLDPRARRGFIYTPGEMREAKDGILRTANPEIAVPMAELFDWGP